MDDVVVIGGGIIGASTAYFLSKEGRKVKVIDSFFKKKIYYWENLQKILYLIFLKP